MENLDFTTRLLEWNRNNNNRQMPWKGQADPYRIWLSEVILQQTRVDQGTAYYNRFIERFPTIHDLAIAPDNLVFKMWEGLGYYSRCRNLLYTARYISSELEGKFPTTYEEIIRLKGIGTYTAAAISSFAFNAPRAVVDGNVQRVLSRFFGISTPVDTTEGKRLYQDLADALLDKENPAAFNQAIMDFGAVICKPKNPLCVDCFQAPDCEAFWHDLTAQLPVKEKKPGKKTRWFNYFLVGDQERIYIRQRSEKDIWQNLHEFVLVESNSEIPEPAELIRPLMPAGTKFGIVNEHPVLKQVLTHQVINGRFFEVRVEGEAMIPGYHPVYRKDLANYAFPKLINGFLNGAKNAQNLS